jgi:GNAT superfamily N-acetyltransferase
MDRQKKMITIERITTSNSDEYLYTERLLTASFPRDEYRALHQQRSNVDGNETFCMNILCDDGCPIGLLSYWRFDDYIYIEHFAIEGTKRNKGYGALVLKQLLKTESKVVLEVELPTDETSRRRIGFYGRCGFEMCDREYIQPAYRADSNEVPMRLMACGIDMASCFEQIRNEIYRTVYGKI